MGGIIGKFLKGVSDVAVPAAVANQAAQIELKRMEKLQGYNQQNIQAQQDFAVQNMDTRQGYAVDNLEQQQDFAVENREQQQKMTLENQDQQNIFTSEENQKMNDLTAQGLEIEGERLELAKQQAEIVLETAELGLVDQRRLSALYESAVDPDIDEAQRNSISEQILVLTGQVGDRFSALYRDKVDETGYATGGRDTFILNNMTKEVSGIPDQANNSSNPAASADQEEQEYRDGDIINNPSTGERMVLRNGNWTPL